MKCKIVVSTVHGEKIPVDVDSVDELEKMAAGEFSRKGLDGADQSYAGKEKQGEDYRPASITRDLQDHQTLQDYDFKGLTAEPEDGGSGRRRRMSSNGIERPTMKEEEEEKYSE